ncbi:unnamed protein product [Ixodes pacificus]
MAARVSSHAVHLPDKKESTVLEFTDTTESGGYDAGKHYLPPMGEQKVHEPDFLQSAPSMVILGAL